MSCGGECSNSEHSQLPAGVRQHQIDTKVELDDVWGIGDDDEGAGGDYVDRAVNVNADIQRSHEKQGYLDGLSSSKEESLQQGFDEGFPGGAQLGLTVGKILCKLKLFRDEDLFNQAKKELNIVKVLDKTYFSDNLTVTSDHEVIQKWQNLVRALQ